MVFLYFGRPPQRVSNKVRAIPQRATCFVEDESKSLRNETTMQKGLSNNSDGVYVSFSVSSPGDDSSCGICSRALLFMLGLLDIARHGYFMRRVFPPGIHLDVIPAAGPFALIP